MSESKKSVKLSHFSQDLFRKNLRRTVIRYVNLSTVLVYRLVSFRVQQRFPGCSHLLVQYVINSF